MANDDADMKGVVMNGRKILIVDDEDSIRLLFSRVIAKTVEGVTTEAVADGKKAVESFSNGRHDVIMMDLHMPIMDGLTAYSEIVKVCEDNEWDMPTVIFCTGYVPPDTVRDIVKDSKHILINKPASVENLVKSVREGLCN